MSIVDPNYNTSTNNTSAPTLAEQLSNNKQSFTNSAATVGNGTTNTTNTTSKTDPKNWDLFHAGRLFGSPISRNMGSNVIKTLVDKLTEIYSTADDTLSISIIPLDKDGTSLAFGGVIVCARQASQPDSTVYFHTLILESTGEPLRNRTYTTPGVVGSIEYEVTWTTPQAWDAEYVKVVTEKVATRFKTNNVAHVDATVVPRDFPFDNNERVWALGVNAICAVANESLRNQPGWTDFTIKDYLRYGQYNIVANFNNTYSTYDVVDQPIKSDIVLEYVLSRKNQQPYQQGQYTSVNKDEADTSVGVIRGYMDLIWSYQSSPMGVMNNGYFTNTAIPPIYTANLIITSLESEKLLTPGGILFGLVNSMALDRDQMWKQYFRPSDKPNFDLRDIGCIGYELIPHLAQFGQTIDKEILSGANSYIDFKSDKVPAESVYHILNMAINQNIFVSLDVPDAGPSSWCLSMFHHASMGEQGAIDLIIKAANDLTCGNFSKHFNSGSQMFYNQGNRVHLGYYRDSDGNKQDIRDITYLAVLSMCKGDVSQVRDFSETYNRVDYDNNLRLSARKKIIQSCTGDNAVFTGYANRVTFSKEFLYALTRACADCGYLPRVQIPLNPMNVGNYRAIPSYLQGVLLDRNYLSVSNGGYGQPATFGNQYYMAGPARHWNGVI